MAEERKGNWKLCWLFVLCMIALLGISPEEGPSGAMFLAFALEFVCCAYLYLMGLIAGGRLKTRWTVALMLFFVIAALWPIGYDVIVNGLFFNQLPSQRQILPSTVFLDAHYLWVATGAVLCGTVIFSGPVSLYLLYLYRTPVRKDMIERMFKQWG